MVVAVLEVPSGEAPFNIGGCAVSHAFADLDVLYANVFGDRPDLPPLCGCRMPRAGAVIFAGRPACHCRSIIRVDRDAPKRMLQGMVYAHELRH